MGSKSPGSTAPPAGYSLQEWCRNPLQLVWERSEAKTHTHTHTTTERCHARLTAKLAKDFQQQQKKNERCKTLILPCSLIHSRGWGGGGGGQGRVVVGVGLLVGGGHGGECRCLKVKGRAANWGGSEVMSFSILSLSAPARWHHLAILSIHLTLHPPIPPPTPQHGDRGEEGAWGRQEKTVYFRTGLLIYLDWA